MAKLKGLQDFGLFDGVASHAIVLQQCYTSDGRIVELGSFRVRVVQAPETRSWRKPAKLTNNDNARLTLKWQALMLRQFAAEYLHDACLCGM